MSSKLQKKDSLSIYVDIDSILYIRYLILQFNLKFIDTFDQKEVNMWCMMKVSNIGNRGIFGIARTSELSNLSFQVRALSYETELEDFSITPQPGELVKAKAAKYTPYKFVDRAQIEVRGGTGGNGCISFQTLSPGRKRPSGGSGGSKDELEMISLPI